MNNASASQSRPARYVRREDFETRIEQVELPVETWTVFAELTRPASVEELAARLGSPAADIQTAIDQLVERQLARKVAISWRDFSAIKAATTAPFPASGTSATIVSVKTVEAPTPAPWPEAKAPAAHRAPAGRDASLTLPAPTARVAPVSFRISSPNTTARRPAFSLRLARAGFVAAETRATPPAKTTVWKLRPVLDAIGGKAGGGVAGQLLIYRVFLNIPTELMQAAGLHSLSLVNNDFTVTHPEFRAALADAARRHAGVDIDRVLPAN